MTVWAWTAPSGTSGYIEIESDDATTATFVTKLGDSIIDKSYVKREFAEDIIRTHVVNKLNGLPNWYSSLEQQ